MAVIVALDFVKSLDEVFNNTHKLAGSSLSEERDLTLNKTELKKD